jgi:hypothetical protein
MQELRGLHLHRHCTDVRDFAETSRLPSPIPSPSFRCEAIQSINLSNHPTHDAGSLPATSTPLDSGRVNKLHISAAWPRAGHLITRLNSRVGDPSSPAPFSDRPYHLTTNKRREHVHKYIFLSQTAREDPLRAPTHLP